MITTPTGIATDITSLNNLDLEGLYFKIGVMLQEHGNMPINISVLQGEANEFDMHYEDRGLCADMVVLNKPEGGKVLELYV